MKRDEWVNWYYGVDDNADENIKKHTLEAKVVYELKDFKRGWVASYIEPISNDAWMNELTDDEDGVYISPTITKWCEENCTGKWEAADPLWWEFELPPDAVAFKLRWG